MVMRLVGSVMSSLGMNSLAPGDRWDGRAYAPALMRRKSTWMFSSSNGSEPHSSAYRMTPALHTSTSGPAYSRPEMTSGAA